MRQTWKPGNMLYPLPVVMVTTKDENKTNVLAVAWCGNVCTNPPMVYISLRKSRRSYENIQRLDEFVINLVNEDLAYACDYSGVKSGKDVDKFKELNLHEIDIEGVSVKGIKESPVCLGCKVFKMIELGSHVMIIANVLSVNVDDTYLDDKQRFDLDKAKLITYSHGAYYSLKDVIGKFGYSVKKSKDNKRLLNK